MICQLLTNQEELMKIQRALCFVAVVVASVLAGGSLILATEAGEQPAVTVRWAEVVRVSKTTPTLQVVALPPLRRGSKIHDRAFQVLQELGCDYVRYAPWYPYPKLAVAIVTLPKG
jgi:cytochrome bd-type quinol oxidase subunit 2